MMKTMVSGIVFVQEYPHEITALRFLSLLHALRLFERKLLKFHLEINNTGLRKYL